MMTMMFPFRSGGDARLNDRAVQAATKCAMMKCHKGSFKLSWAGMQFTQLSAEVIILNTI